MAIERRESVTGLHLTAIKIQERQQTKYFSGQGKVFAAKRDVKGIPGEFCFLGNICKMSVFASGRIEMTVEAWQKESWPLLFGGEGKEVIYEDATFEEFSFNPNGNAGEYYLMFEGVNTANNNQATYLEMFRVTFEAASRIDFISDEIAGFPLVGVFHLDETRNGYGLVRVRV